MAVMATSKISGRVHINIEPLAQTQMNDAQFLKYNERSADIVAMRLRIPRILLGDVPGVNCSTDQELALLMAWSS